VILSILLGIGAIGTAIGAVMTAINLRLYRPAPQAGAAPQPTATDVALVPAISVCIPARNEETNIGSCVQSLLGGTYKSIEVLVYNDQSTDRTGAIVAELTSADARVHAVAPVPLGQGWNGKQFGCEQCGQRARGQWLLFTDADVRFAPDAIARTLAAAERAGCDLISTFPRQITGTLAEKLAVPMIHFILFSYLPMARMRSTRDPAASAGCGQFLFVRRSAWAASGGHAGFKASMHDGIMLPRNVRRSGGRTDLFDGTDLCEVRMYRGLGQTWRGFAKNAFEGLGSVTLLVFLTVLHVCGHILPWGVIAATMLSADFRTSIGPTGLALSATCVVLALCQRAVLAVRFRQSWLAVVLHPFGVAMMTAIQWHSWYLALAGKRTWRGRGDPSVA